MSEKLAKRSKSNVKVIDSTPFRAAIKSNTSPSPSLVSGMLLKTPERAVDDSFPQRLPRDSDIFSPVVRLPPRDYSIVSKSTPGSVCFRDFGDDLIPDVGNTNGFNSEVSAVHSVVDRRMSDIIPTSSSIPIVRSEYSKYEYAGDSKGDILLDSDAVYGFLNSPPPEDDKDFVGATEVSDEPPVNGSATLTKKSSLPRGLAFTRMRKSASEMTLRNVSLLLGPARNNTLPKSAEKEDCQESLEIPKELNDGQKPDIANYMAGVEQLAYNSSGSLREETGRTIPPLERKNTTSMYVSALADVVRQTIIAEMDLVRQDIRADVLNTHAELVLSFSIQTREIEQMFIRQKKEIDELRDEVASLRKEFGELRHVNS